MPGVGARASARRDAAAAKEAAEALAPLVVLVTSRLCSALLSNTLNFSVPSIPIRRVFPAFARGLLLRLFAACCGCSPSLGDKGRRSLNRRSPGRPGPRGRSEATPRWRPRNRNHTQLHRLRPPALSSFSSWRSNGRRSDASRGRLCTEILRWRTIAPPRIQPLRCALHALRWSECLCSRDPLFSGTRLASS